jgi:hypothetical protein
VRAPGAGAWSLLRGYSATATYSWNTAGKAAGTYQFSVWVKDVTSPNSYDSYSAFSYTLTVTRCTAATSTTVPSGTAPVGTTVAVSAAATGCPNPLFEFWIRPPGGAWSLVRAYASGATYNWATTGKVAGAYQFSIWVRDASSPNTYDTYAMPAYTLTAARCTGATTTFGPPIGADAGTPIAVTTAASGCPNPRYKVWVRAPGGSWALLSDYSSNPTYVWDTTGKVSGTYEFSVWVRDASSPNSYDAYGSGTYNVSVVPCTNPSSSTNPQSPAQIGTVVSISATASCDFGLFEFWIKAPGGKWTLVQGYSTTSTYTWNTAREAAGTYEISIWIRDRSSPTSYDVYQMLSYTLT